IQELKENIRLLRSQRHFYHDKDNFVAADQEFNQEGSYYIDEQSDVKRGSTD
ncbi:hypothetical protein WUBG_10807, partial [Wuchereria bancrofti]